MSNYPYQQLSLFPQNQMQQPYQQQMQQPVVQQVQPTMPIQSNIVWVASEEIAKQYPVAPGGTVYFMNENEPYFYAKSADMMGRPSFRKSRMIDEDAPEEKKVDLTNYIKREEIENIISDAVQREVERRMSEISFKPTRKQKVVEVVED